MRELIWLMDPQMLERKVAQYEEFISTLAAFQAGPAQKAMDQGLPLQIVGSTAVVSIKGPMVKSLPPLIAEFCPNSMAVTTRIENAIDAALSDNKISEIVLWIDSPGGSVDGTVELADAIQEAASQKRIVAQVDGMAASAAYWVASQANEIVASRSSLVGSIGVFAVLYDQSEQYEREGIKVIPVTTGTYKGAGIAGTKISKEIVADQQRIVDGYFQEFKNAVLRGRVGLTADQVDAVADGRVFIAGTEGLAQGLVDRIGTMKSTLRESGNNQEKRLVVKQRRIETIEHLV